MKKNWKQRLVFLLVSILGSWIVVSSYDWGFYELVSFSLLIYFTLLLISKLGKTLPIRELASFIYVVQILIGAILTYKFYPNIKIGYMSVPEDTYYPYALPCVVVFILGLYFPRFKYTGYDVREVISKSVNEHEWSRFGLSLIALSFLTQVFSSIFPSDGLNFIYAILSYSRFIGLFYIFLAKYKYRYILFIIIFGPFVTLSLGGGLFIELFIWTFLTFAIFQLRKPLKFRTNLIAFLVGIVLVFVLQSVKGDFRQASWKGSDAGTLGMVDRLSLLGNLVSNTDFSDSKTRDLANIHFIVRINEGFIVASILRNMPAHQDFVDGEFFKNELVGIVLPRFLFPDKAVVGDHEKFEKFAGWKLSNRVAMSVSILGDGYGNFGYAGGILFCFLNGVMLNLLLHFCVRLAKKYEKTLILWMPMIFAFSMRCGDEFYIITNHIIKSSILIFILLFVARRLGKLSGKSVANSQVA